MLVAQLSEWLGAVAVAWLFSISPRLKHPPVGFKYARRDGITALMLYGLILVLAFVFYSMNPLEFPANLRPAPAPVANLDRALLVAAVALALFVVALVMRKQPFRSMGWSLRAARAEETEAARPDKRAKKANRQADKPAPKAPDVFMPALQVGFALAILTLFLRNRVMDILGGVSAAELNYLLLAIGISLAEETIFRGYIQLRLSWWLGKWPGIALTAALFTLWHVPAWLNQVPPETGLLLAGLTLVQGLVLGWIMSITKNVIAPALYRSISIWMYFLG
jgi:membrane protease YdiL (CAAX protease family)